MKGRRDCGAPCGCQVATHVQANTLASASGSSSLHPAESFAQLLLERPSASLGDLLKLFDLLPHEPAPVAGRAEAGGFSFGLGAWVHGNLVGLRTNTYTFPLSTSVFTRHVARHLPQHTFSSLVVLDNVCTLAHRDSHNEPSSKNAVFGLSDFTGGEVWVERAGGSTPYAAEGKTLLGDALSTQPGPAVFAARAELHATLPWSGRRVVLVAYTTSHLHKLSSEAQRSAAKLGFKHFAPQVASSCFGDSSLSRRDFQRHGGAVPCSFCFGFCRPGCRPSASLCPDAYCAP